MQVWETADWALPVFGASTVGLIGSPRGQGHLLSASVLFSGRTAPWKQRPSLHGHVGLVYQVAFSPDRKRLASAGLPLSAAAQQEEPGEIKVWDGESGQAILSPRWHTAGVLCVAFSPDG